MNNKIIWSIIVALVIAFVALLIFGRDADAKGLECEEGYKVGIVVVQEAVPAVEEVSHMEYSYDFGHSWTTRKVDCFWRKEKKVIDQEYVPAIPEKTERQCVVDEDYVFPTHRWCEKTEGGYTAIAVPNNEENPEGMEWVTGMDKNCEFPVEPEPVVKKESDNGGCEKIGSMQGLHIWDGHLLRWATRSSADKVDVSAYEADSTTDVYKIRTDDDGEFDLNTLPHATWFKIRGVRAGGNCRLGNWTEKVME